MAKIKPIEIWKDGQSFSATDLLVRGVSDDFLTCATFFWELKSEDGISLTNGNLEINGEDYQEWGEASDVNQEAYEFTASKLSIELE